MEIESNFFKLLGVPVNAEIDHKQIKKRSRELLREYHPDRYVNASDLEQRLAVQYSAHINTAVEVLSKMASRVAHLFEVYRVTLPAENQTIRDRMFLMEQMTLRESLEDITEVSRAPENLLAMRDNRSPLCKFIDSMKDKVAEQGASIFQAVLGSLKDDHWQGGDQALAHLQDEFAKLQFFDKLYQEAVTAKRLLNVN